MTYFSYRELTAEEARKLYPRSLVIVGNPRGFFANPKVAPAADKDTKKSPANAGNVTTSQKKEGTP